MRETPDLRVDPGMRETQYLRAEPEMRAEPGYGRSSISCG